MKTLGTIDAAVSNAVNGWRLALTGRFRLLDQWCAFVQVIGFLELLTSMLLVVWNQSVA